MTYAIGNVVDTWVDLGATCGVPCAVTPGVADDRHSFHTHAKQPNRFELMSEAHASFLTWGGHAHKESFCISRSKATDVSVESLGKAGSVKILTRIDRNVGLPTTTQYVQALPFSAHPCRLRVLCCIRACIAFWYVFTVNTEQYRSPDACGVISLRSSTPILYPMVPKFLSLPTTKKQTHTNVSSSL